MSALPDQFGMDTHVLTHAREEEFWTLSAPNVSAQQVTGTVLPVSSALILKSGQLLDYHVLVLMETGTASLVLSA